MKAIQLNDKLARSILSKQFSAGIGIASFHPDNLWFDPAIDSNAASLRIEEDACRAPGVTNHNSLEFSPRCSTHKRQLDQVPLHV